MRLRKLRWPYPYRWAFGITDDTDGATLESTRAVYGFCAQLGIRPTKTVWTQKAVRRCGDLHRKEPDPGLTLEDGAYREYCQELSRQGVEFALHGVSPGNNLREDTLRGFERFEEIFGHPPRLYVCHSLNAENPYWGENHFRSPVARRLVRTLMGRRERFHGERPDSPYYWTDVGRETIDYVRLFRTLDLNVLRRNPMMPYHDPAKPEVRFWFSACAQDHEVCKYVTDEKLDRVAREDGALILYAHMHGFFGDGDGYPTESRLRPEVDRAFRIIGSRDDCWRVGVCSILDRCLAMKNVVLHRRRHAVVVSNPTAIPLPDFQIEADRPLYMPGGDELLPDESSRLRVGDLPAHSSIALFFTRSGAQVGDPAGISWAERVGMMVEEAKHLVWQHSGGNRFNWLRR